MKTKAPKARVMWANGQFFTHRGIAEKLLRSAGLQFHFNQPVSVLPRSKEAQEAMIEAGAKALFQHSWHPKDEPDFVRLLRIGKGHFPTWEQLITEHPENAIVRNCRAKSRAVFASANLVSKSK